MPRFIQPSIGVIGRMHCQGHSQNRSVRRQQPFKRCATEDSLPSFVFCREAALAARKGSGQGNADIKPLIDLIKISDAEYRKHSSAARKKLNESQSAVLCPASACTDRSARAGDGTSSDKQPGQQGSRQDAEPWWMSPAPNRPGGFQVC